MKKILAIIFALLIAALPAFVFADASFPYISDNAEAFSEDEWDQLNSIAYELNSKHSVTAYYITIDELANYGYGIDEIEEFTADVYDEYDFAEDAVILCVATMDRKYDIMAHGEGNYAFTDYGKSVIQNGIVAYLSSESWADAGEEFFAQCDYMLKQAENGTPVDVNMTRGDDLSLGEKLTRALPIGAGLGAIISGLRVSGQKRRMKTAELATSASNYVVDGGAKLVERDDIFTFSEERVQHIERNDSSGGTTVDDRGNSHASGSF